MKKKVAAFSMIETIVAMVIIISLLGVGLMIFLNVLGGDKSAARIKAVNMCEYYSTAFKNDEIQANEAVEEDGINLQVTVMPQQKEHLSLLYISAKNEKGSILAERKELIWQN